MFEHFACATTLLVFSNLILCSYTTLVFRQHSKQGPYICSCISSLPITREIFKTWEQDILITQSRRNKAHINAVSLLPFNT